MGWFVKRKRVGMVVCDERMAIKGVLVGGQFRILEMGCWGDYYKLEADFVGVRGVFVVMVRISRSV